MIREKGLNRVVVAACTPRSHEPVFRDTLREGGINQFFYEMAIIREHSSWVHSKEKEEATQKTKEKELGGMARRIRTTLDGMDVPAFLQDMVRSVYQHPLVHVCHDATIKNVSGYVGNFTTTVKTEGRVKTIKHGAAILATGAAEYKPTEYLYGRDDRVVTQMELEERIHDGDDRLAGAETLVMIQCVGCRNAERNYCSRICCTHAIKNALTLKEINPGLNIYVLFRDMRTDGFNENQ